MYIIKNILIRSKYVYTIQRISHYKPQPYQPLTAALLLLAFVTSLPSQIAPQSQRRSSTMRCQAAATSFTPNLPFCHPAQSPSRHFSRLHFRRPNPLSSANLYLLRSPSSPRLAHRRPVRLSSAVASMAETEPFSVLFVCLGALSRPIFILLSSVSHSRMVFSQGTSAVAPPRRLCSPISCGSVERSPSSRSTPPAPSVTMRYSSILKIGTCERKRNCNIFLGFAVWKGDPADSRMRSAAKRRGIEVTSISRPLRPSDFREFDLILAMDMQNRGAVCCSVTHRVLNYYMIETFEFR